MAVVIRGEVALPTNPNCVLFACPSAQALAKGWLELQRVAWSGLEQFYSACGIDCVAYFGRRSWLDRRNQSVDQVLLMFVFDGPATQDDLALIDKAVAKSGLPFSKGAMESMQPDAFPSLIVKSGKMYQLWSLVEDIPRCLRLEFRGERLAVVGETEKSAKSSMFLPYLKHVVATRRAIKDEDWRMERMRIVFAHHFSEKIIEADGVVHDDEKEFLARVFPADVMRQMGVDTDEPYKQALDEAFEQLPNVLGHHDKLAMIGLFFGACHSDGNLAATEMKVLKEAATSLGVKGSEVVNYLTKLW